MDGVLAGLLRPLVDQDLSMVFYDLTTIRTAGLTHFPGCPQVRDEYGRLIARQFILGIVQTAVDCRAITRYSRVTAKAPTLLPTVDQVLSRFPSIRRLILVADRGLLSLDNIEHLQGVKLKSGEPLEFIIAVPGRRYNEFSTLLNGFHDSHCKTQSIRNPLVNWFGKIYA